MATLDRSQYTEPLLAYVAARDSGTPDVDRLESAALEANLGIARAFARRHGRDHHEDVLAAAREGLLVALRKWSPEGGANLCTWAQGPMRDAVRRVQEHTGPVRVARKTLRLALSIQASGEDVEAACQRLGKKSGPIKAALQIGPVRELTTDIGTASIEDSIAAAELRDEMQSALRHAAKCWRGEDVETRLLRSAVSLTRRRAELLDGETPQPALAEAMWPRDADARVGVLARLDYALSIAARSLGKSKRSADSVEVDVECWARHYVNGEKWTTIGKELGVSRTRVQTRAKRAEPAIARALAVAAQLGTDALEVWARRPAEVVELERLGVLELNADPLTILYAVEDLEVALTEIDGRSARVWSARSHGDEQHGVGRKALRDLLRRADAALRSLLRREPEESERAADQLPLFPAVEPQPEREPVWWSPLAKEAAATVTTAIARLRSAARRGLNLVSARARSAARRWAESTSPGDGLLAGLIDCTGPPEDARAQPMILRLQC